MASQTLPELPASHSELVNHIAEHPQKSMMEMMEPYRNYEARLREVYAQDRQNPILEDPHLNVVPLFTENTSKITTRARNLSAESPEEKSRYIMSLPDDKRRPHGSPATVANLTEFQHNFNVFSESSLVEMDWSNVVAAGSSVVNCLLPVPKEFSVSKKKLREYYHEKFCPASDVDLFLYGLTHDEAIEKIKQIERAVKDALLNEVTVVRTKYAITIASSYPVRHIQVVLRVYKSVSEILTGFDIDAAGGAYDGKQVYVTPRALGSFITQVNHVDLSRRSPSYENRLSKYSHRNFEVYWPELDRSRIDPTIFERSFQRTLGLARLLVLERLPTTHARENYLNKRREERGRPAKPRYFMPMRGNLKEVHEDEVADWLSEEDISNYHTFTVPYGERFNAKKIEKLCYTRDLLLNAEWNQSKDREVYLHRHPAFFGRVQDVIEDCCGSCPKPVTPEEHEVADKEAEIYISGKISFLIDDPGRQQIGSFNPLTEQDWTDMAYVGNTARLCQSIVAGDVDEVLNWLSQEGADPNQRDYTGRTPLHLAVMTSTSDVVKCLVDHGARLTARLADGKTALHLAAARGDAAMIKILMEKSIENEEIEEERKSQRRKAAQTDKKGEPNKPEVITAHGETEHGPEDDASEASDGEIVDGEQTEAELQSIATGSFVKVKKSEPEGEADLVPEESDDEPDYFQIDVLAWDTPCSPLHLAVLEGHEEAVELLCDYGADSILPVKFLRQDHSQESAAILTLTLALSLPTNKAVSMARLLLKLGATSSQADSQGCTAFYQYVNNGDRELVDVLLNQDKTGVKNSINHLFFSGYMWNLEVMSPLQAAVAKGDSILVLKLLNTGALTSVDFDTWLKSAKTSPKSLNNLGGDLDRTRQSYKTSYESPLFAAIQSGNAEMAELLLENGADHNALTARTNELFVNKWRWNYTEGRSVLDAVLDTISKLRKYQGEAGSLTCPKPLKGADEFLARFEQGSYAHWVIAEDIRARRKSFVDSQKCYLKEVERQKVRTGAKEKNEAIQELVASFVSLERVLIAKGAKPFSELHPEIDCKKPSYKLAQELVDKNEDKPYKFEFKFTQDKEMTEKRQEGYVQLMQACWEGNLDRIKAFTLQAWGDDNDQAPLKVDIRDNTGNTPFSVAFLRGRHDVARAILEIVKAHWSPAEKDQLRYRMEQDRDEDDYDESYDEENESDDDEAVPRIVPEVVDKPFTIDDIGKVSMHVKSNAKPVDVLNQLVRTFTLVDGNTSWHEGLHSLFQHVFDQEDVQGLKTLLELGQHFSGSCLSADETEDSASFSLTEQDFSWAVEHGKTRMLALAIKRTGAGIPLDHLVKQSGVEEKQKPRFYQGLTVYGKKRKDWANAGRSVVTRTSGMRSPPLLHAAVAGSLESVEFFLSETSHRIYVEFGKSKAAREDPRFKHLKDSPGGYDRAIGKWLGADNDLVIHCAVLGPAGDDSVELVRYLVKDCSEYVEKRTCEGETPLMLACRLGRTECASILIDAGADQSIRNQRGENILHAAVSQLPKAATLKPLLDLLNPELRSHLFLQRKNLQENGTTPLHTWISLVCGLASDGEEAHMHRTYWNGHSYSISRNTHNTYDNAGEVLDVLQLLLQYSEGHELDMLNGAGETCLHTAARLDRLAIVKALVDFKPALLGRENAVGRTPAEVAHDALTSQALAPPSEHGRDNRNVDFANAIVAKSPESFAYDREVKGKLADELKPELLRLGLSGKYKSKDLALIKATVGIVRGEGQEELSEMKLKQVMWDIVSTAMAKTPAKRRLVSLNEANDVAKRLGEKHTGSRYFSIENRRQEGEDEDGSAAQKSREPPSDFVTRTLPSVLSSAWKVPETSENADDE